MNTYKLRAECLNDFLKFKDRSLVQNISIIQQNKKLPDIEVSFSSEQELSQLKNILKNMIDSHVMLETIELEINYTGVRL